MLCRSQGTASATGWHVAVHGRSPRVSPDTTDSQLEAQCSPRRPAVPRLPDSCGSIRSRYLQLVAESPSADFAARLACHKHDVLSGWAAQSGGARYDIDEYVGRRVMQLSLRAPQ